MVQVLLKMFVWFACLFSKMKGGNMVLFQQPLLQVLYPMMAQVEIQ